MPNVLLTRRLFLQNLALVAAASALWPALAADDGAAIMDPAAPPAKALGYVEDGGKVDARKEPLFKAGRRCSNCASFQAAQAKGDYAPCAIFAGAAVRKNGWCRAWAAKPEDR